MDPHTKAILSSAGSEIVDALRQVVTTAALRYEQQTGAVVTRVELYRKGSDWCVDVRTIAELPPAMRDEKFT